MTPGHSCALLVVLCCAPAREIGDHGLVLATMSADGKYVMTLSDHLFRQQVAVWRIGDLKPVATYQVNGLARGLVFHPSRHTALISDGTGFIEWHWTKKDATPISIFSPEARTKQSIQDSNNSQFLDVSSDGKIIAIFDTLGNIKTQEIPNGKPRLVAKVELPEHFSRRICFVPGTHLLSFNNLENLHVFNADRPQGVCVFKGHKDQIRSIHGSPDGKFLVTGSRDGTVRVWNVETKDASKILTFKNGGTVARFSPDGSHLVCADDVSIYVYAFKETKLIAKWKGPTSGVMEILISKDNRTVITIGEGLRPRYWDVQLKKEKPMND